METSTDLLWRERALIAKMVWPVGFVVSWVAVMFRRMFGFVDVLVLTAIPMEYAAMRSLLVRVSKRRHRAGTVYEVGQISGTRITICLGMVGVGNRSAAALIERAIATFRPRTAFFVGIAGARHTDLEIGDIVVASRVYGLHSGKLSQAGFHERVRSWEAPLDLIQAVNQLLGIDWRATLPPGSRVSVDSKVVVRPIAAGEAVVNAASGALSEEVDRSYGDTAAYDMESSGAAEAAHLNGRLPMLTIRGISDRIDHDKDKSDLDRSQEVAAAHSAAFAAALIVFVAGSARTAAVSRRRLAAIVTALTLVLASAVYLAVAGAPEHVFGPGGPAASGTTSQATILGTSPAAPVTPSVAGASAVATLPTSIVITPPAGGPGTRFVISGHCGPPCLASPEAEAINVIWIVNGQECLSQQIQTEVDGGIWPTALRNVDDAIVEFDSECDPLILASGAYELRFVLYAQKPGLEVTRQLKIS